MTVSRGFPTQPQRRHHWSNSSTRQARTARSGSRRCPTTSRPSSSRRQNVVKSGAAKVASGTSGSSGWLVLELPSSEALDAYPDSATPAHTSTATTPSSVKSPQRDVQRGGGDHPLRGRGPPHAGATLAAAPPEPDPVARTPAL